jgi:hypothetical protein
MKLAVTALLVAVAVAAPQGSKETGLGIGGVPTGSNMLATIAALKDKNGLLDAGVMPKIRNEILEGSGCGKAVFIFARASQEPANMVILSIVKTVGQRH